MSFSTSVSPTPLLLFLFLFLPFTSSRSTHPFSNDVSSSYFSSLYPYSSFFSPPSTSTFSKEKLLRRLVTRDDKKYDVKLLPAEKEVSIYLEDGEEKRLVFPLAHRNPLVIMVTPCAMPIAWTLSLRPLESAPTSPDRRRDQDVTGEVLRHYEGHEAIEERMDEAMPGLYVLQVWAVGGGSHVHVGARTSSVSRPSPGRVRVTYPENAEGATLTWDSDSRHKNAVYQYCLVVSERPFPSLCAARDALPPRDAAQAAHAAHAIYTPTLIMGCTAHPSYFLPKRPANTLYVAVWSRGKGGPPVSKGIVPAFPRSSASLHNSLHPPPSPPHLPNQSHLPNATAVEV